MKFSTYQFENNGDLFAFDETADQIHIGRCDSDGDIEIDIDFDVDATHEEIIMHVHEVLVDTVRRSIKGSIDWTPDECWLKAAGIRDDYRWDGVAKKWIEAVKR